MKTLHFSPTPPWAIKASLGVILLMLPLGFFIKHSVNERWQSQQSFDAVQVKLHAHRLAAEKISQSQREFNRQRPQDTKSIPAMLPLKLIGEALNDDVTLVSVAIDASAQRVQLSVVADSLNNLLDFTTRLQIVSSKVELGSHAVEVFSGGHRKVKASLTMDYAHED